MSDNTPLEMLVAQVRDLPALSEIALKVVRLADDPRSAAIDVARLLSTDQALAARVLKLANSAFYGAARAVKTIPDAVVMLGMGTVRDLAMAASCQDVLNNPLHGYAVRRGDLWRHSSCCAFAAKRLAKRSRFRSIDEAFIAGLLHDIGKVIVDVHMADSFEHVLELAQRDQIPFMEAEQRILGFNHAEAGALVLEKWNLPISLVECVRYHHTPLKAPEYFHLTSIVHLADIMCVMLGIGLGVDGLSYPLERAVLELLELSEEDFEIVLHEVSAISQEKMLA